MKLTIADRVKKLLIDKPHLRDSDNKLIASVWYLELNKTKKVEDMTGMEVLKELAHGNLSSSESIRRSRQKLQEELPELRGKTYKHRKEIEEPETRQEIREFQT